jgi:hypothetical protein
MGVTESSHVDLAMAANSSSPCAVQVGAMRDAAAAAAELGPPALPVEEKQPCALCFGSGRLYSAEGLHDHQRAVHPQPLKRRGAVAEVLPSAPLKRRRQR